MASSGEPPQAVGGTLGGRGRCALARAYLWLAHRRMLACGFCALVVLAARAALLPWWPVPNPAYHDEFSMLLAADTYVHGRLANASPALWQHFETFHVLVSPVYASKYPILQGVVLAFGQAMFGEPWLGVYLSMGLMAAVLCWMLQGWISPGWALLGALAFALKVGVVSYWMNSYMGGAVPGIGGALMLGAVGRIWRHRQLGQTASWAVGLAILVHSRPYDAAVLGLATGAMLAWAVFQERPPRLRALARMCGLAGPVLGCAFGAVLVINTRITGNAFTLPYQAHDQQYAVAPLFAVLPLRPQPEYRHAVMQRMWAEWNVSQWRGARAAWLDVPWKVLRFVEFFFGFPFLMVGVLLAPFPQMSREERAAALLGGVFLLMITPLIDVMPHYGAAFAGVLYLRFVQCLRRLSSWRPGGRPAGAGAAAVIAGLVACWFGSSILVLTGHRGLFKEPRDMFSAAHAVTQARFGNVRARLQEQIGQRPGKHLVLVRYSQEHIVHGEWVYNRADIDASPVVWAREMDPAADRRLLEYFADRQAWLLEADASPPRLHHYEDRP